MNSHVLLQIRVGRENDLFIESLTCFVFTGCGVLMEAKKRFIMRPTAVEKVR